MIIASKGFRASGRSGGALVGLAILLGTIGQVWADDDFIVYSPHVVDGQSEIEMRGFTYSDARPAFNQTGAFEVSVAHTFTSWWKVEYYAGEYNQGPTIGTQFAGQELENTFQLADAGEYWADPGFLVSYIHSTIQGIPDGAEFGPLFEKQVGRVLQRLNVLWDKSFWGPQMGRYGFRTAYSAGYAITSTIVPGFEAYDRPIDHAHQIGPAFSGELHLGHGDELEYSTALLYGVNYGAPDKTLVMRMEYEFF